MTKIQQKLETFFAGFLYVAIGTVVAIQVNAQNSTKCDVKTSPDALCAIAPAAVTKPDFKVCFSNKHPRCFELQKSKLIQSLNGMPAHDVTIDAKQADQVTKAVKEYRSWLENKKAQAPTSVCRNIVTVDLSTDHKALCVSAVPQKELQEKNKSLIEMLETPPGATSQR